MRHDPRQHVGIAEDTLTASGTSRDREDGEEKNQEREVTMIGPLVVGFLLLSWLAFSLVFFLGLEPSTNWFVTFSGAFARGLLYSAVPFVPLSALLKAKQDAIRPARARLLVVCKVYLVGVVMALLAVAQHFGWIAGPPPLLAPGIH
jgi:hypothetical protein